MRPYFRKIFQPGVAFLLVLILNQPILAQQGSAGNRPVATVNAVEIKQSDLESEIRQLKMEMDFRNRSLPESKNATLRDQVAETLIERELLYQKAQERDLHVRARWVDRALDELELRLKNHAMSMQDFLAGVDANKEALRERIRKGLIVQRVLRRDVLRQIKVSEIEMQKYYQRHPEYFKREEQVRARHILIALPYHADEEKRSQAMLQIQALAGQLAQGADFGMLALEYSACPSKNKGGDLGYFTREQMIREISEAAFRLQPGELSEVITTRYGYHLVQVLDRKPPSQMPYRNVRDKIERTLRRNKEKAAAASFLAALKKKAVIVRNLP